MHKVNHSPNVPVSTGYASTQTVDGDRLARVGCPGYVGMWLLGTHSHTQEAAVAGHLVPGAAVCAGTSVRDSALVKLSFLLLPFHCCLSPAQVLLEEVKCYTYCFEALRFSRINRLHTAASCFTCSALNQGLRHWLHQKWCLGCCLTAQEKIEMETTLFWVLLVGCQLSRWYLQKYQAWTHAASNSAATSFSSWCQPESWCTGFSSCSMSAVWK